MISLALAIVFFTMSIVIFLAILATYYYFNKNQLGTLGTLFVMVGIVFLAIYLIQNL